MAVLPRILGTPDLPAAELQAARLDGELYPAADGFAPIDEIETPASRAHAALVGAGPGVIAERRTAAWIWGALPRAPRPAEVCIDSSRGRCGVHRLAAPPREVLITAAEVVDFGQARVTTVLRTVVDLARFPGGGGGGGGGDDAAIRRLMVDHDLELDGIRDYLAGRPRLPGKRAVLPRIERALDGRHLDGVHLDGSPGQPEFTRYTS